MTYLNINLIVIYSIILLFFLNCASSIEKENRKNDFLDIFILGFEKELYGIGVSFVVPFGLCYGVNAEGFGIHYGHIGKYKAGGYKHYIRDDWFHTLGNCINEEFTPILPLPRNKNKNFKLSVPIIKIRSTHLIEKPYLFDIYVRIGIKYGIKIGINFDELFDFLVGFIGADPKEDDLMSNGLYAWEITEQKKIEEENKKAFKRCLKSGERHDNKYKKQNKEFCKKNLHVYRECMEFTVQRNPELRKQQLIQKQEYCKKYNIYLLVE